MTVVSSTTHTTLTLVPVAISSPSAKDNLTRDPESMDEKTLRKLIDTTEKQMRKAAAELDFETAAELRDKLKELKEYLGK